MAAQGAFGTDFYDRSTRTIVGVGASPTPSLGAYDVFNVAYV